MELQGEVAIEINGVWTRFRRLPGEYNGAIGYNSPNNLVQQKADGWKDLVQPIFNPSTHKKTNIIIYVELDDNCTYKVEEKTAEEQAEYQQQLEDADEFSVKQNRRRSDGYVLIFRFFAYIHRQVDKGNITPGHAAKSSNLLLDALTFLRFGEFELAKNYINNIDTSGEAQGVIDILDLALQRIQNYLDNE